MSQPGRLITIEGIDGVGKTTLADGLARALSQRGIAVELLREPGGVELSERLRELVKDPALTVGARAEALIYAAARAQLVEEAVRPRLAAGSWIVLDRFVDSSLAYQGAGRGLGVDTVAALNALATDGLVPDRTLLLALDPSVARARAGERGTPQDRLEREQGGFFLRVGDTYEQIAEREPDRVRTIDAALPPDEVLSVALTAVEDLLARAQPRG